MRVHLIPTNGEPLPPLHLAEIPRAGDTLTHPETLAQVWRVTRVHWPIEDGLCEAVELHLARIASEL